MKIVTSILLSLVSFTLLAQNPTYDQTVEYIKKNTVGRMIYEGPLDSYERATGHKLTNIIIEKNGRIQLKTNQKHGIHDFDIVFNIFDLTSSIDYPDGIRAYKYIVHFKGLNVTKGFGITFATENDAIKVARAFRHLKTMCSQDDDLFGKPTVQETKANLTKSETFEYIKNVINNLPTYKTSNDGGSIESEQHISNNYYKLRRGILSGSRTEGYMYYDDSNTYNFDFLNKSIINVEFHQPIIPKPTKWDSNHPYYFYSDKVPEDLRKFFVLELIVEKGSLKEVVNNRSSNYDKGNFWATAAEAKRSCRNDPYSNREYATRNDERIMIYIKEKTDAKRLYKAFSHLSSLLKEEMNSKKANDPFGG